MEVEELNIKKGKGMGKEIGTNNGINSAVESHEKEKTKAVETEILHRLSINGEADVALNLMVDRVNKGFNGGKVNRTQTLSWLLIRQASLLSENIIQEIRAEFFDEISMLESVLRQAKTTGIIPQELRGLLLKQVGVEEQTKRKSKKIIDEEGNL